MYQLIYADPPWRYDNVISNGAAGIAKATQKVIETPQSSSIWIANDRSVNYSTTFPVLESVGRF